MILASLYESIIQPFFILLAVPLALIGVFVAFVLADFAYLMKLGELPSLKEIWLLAVIVPAICGAAVTLGAGGAAIWKRVIGAALCGAGVGVLNTMFSAILAHNEEIVITGIATDCLWQVFLFTILSIVGLLLTEIKLPEPKTG